MVHFLKQAEPLPLPHPFCNCCAWCISSSRQSLCLFRIPFAIVAHGAFPRAGRASAASLLQLLRMVHFLEQAEPLPHSFCSCCAWCISCGNAPCATTAKNLSGRRRRPFSRYCVFS